VCPALLGDTRYDKFIEKASNITVIEMRGSLFYSETSHSKARTVSRKGQLMRIGLSAGMFRHISQTALWGLAFTAWS